MYRYLVYPLMGTGLVPIAEQARTVRFDMAIRITNHCWKCGCNRPHSIGLIQGDTPTLSCIKCNATDVIRADKMESTLLELQALTAFFEKYHQFIYEQGISLY